MKVQWGTSFHQFNVIVENKTPGKVTVFMLTSTESLEQIICTANPKPGSKGVALAKSPEYFTISALLVLISSRIQSYLSILMFTSKLRERRKKTQINRCLEKPGHSGFLRVTSKHSFVYCF